MSRLVSTIAVCFAVILSTRAAAQAGQAEQGGAPFYEEFQDPPGAPPWPDIEQPNMDSMRPRVVLDLRASGQRSVRGGMVDLRLYGDGERMGVSVGATAAFVGGTEAKDLRYWLGDLNLCVLLASGDRGILRFEAGLAGALMRDVKLGGFDLALSGQLRILGPLGIEGAVRVVPFPFQSLDWHGALQLSLGRLDLRAGYRELRIDDGGWSGWRHRSDHQFGPFLGLGLRI